MPPSTPNPVVLLGETMMVFNSPADAPISLHSPVTPTLAGAESNVAIGLSRLGHPARWVSALGDDLFGTTICKTLRGEGVDVSRVVVDRAHPTGVMFKSRRPGAEPEVFYYRRGSAFSHSSPAWFPPDAWHDASVIFLSGITTALSYTCRELVERVLDDAHARNTPVFFDVNYRRKLWPEQEAHAVLRALLPHVHTLLLGYDEGTLLTDGEDPKSIADELLALGPSRVVLKSGSEGAHLFTASSHYTSPAFPVTPVDPIGAGDAFAAGFVSAHLDGLSTTESLARANALGAICCLTRGDWEGLPDRKQLDDFLAKRTGAAR